MSYTLNKTDGTVLLTIADGAVNSTYGVSFFGTNYSGWGERLNENFIQLLENFAKNTQPASSLTGQIWYDTSEEVLKVYDGADYIGLVTFLVDSTEPAGKFGRLWLDSDDDRLYIHNGSDFKVVTPGTISILYDGATLGTGSMDASGDISVTLSSLGASTNSFNTIQVSGQSDVVAGSTADTLTLAAGTGMLLTTDAVSKTITVSPDSSVLVYRSGAQTISDTKEFLGQLKASGTIVLAGTTKAIYADLAPSANTGIRWSSTQWELTNDGTNWNKISTGDHAPANASYLTLGTNGTLTNERVLTAGTGISFTDAGVGSTLTVANTGVTSAVAGSGISVSAATGAVTIANTGVTGLTAGTGINVSAATGGVTVANTGVTSFNGSTGAITYNAFGTVAVSGQSDVVADAANDTLTLVAGTGITITTNASGDAITITNTIADTDTNTTYSISSETDASGAKLRLTGSNSTTDDVVFTAGSGITISRPDASTITIATSGTSGLTAAYTSISDGSNSATASGSDTIKFRGGTGVTTTVTSNDVTHGDNVLISVQDGSTSQKGLVQLSDSTSSTSTTLAATANLANTKLPLAGGTMTGALTVDNSTASTNTVTGAVIVTGGVGLGGSLNVGGNLVVSGNFTVNGTTTTVNSTTTTLDDPIITLGGDDAPVSDDNKDRGVEFRWYSGSGPKVGFFGHDDSIGRFTYIPDATNSSEVFSGTVGDAQFGIVYATATSAQYADLAERYEADAFYEPGTVLVVGGEKEVTACNSYGAANLAGIVSTKPAYLMNSEAGSDITHPAIALKGRVPCKVYGAVKKGDLLTTSAYSGHAESVRSDSPCPLVIVGIALEDNAGGAAVIEVMVK